MYNLVPSEQTSRVRPARYVSKVRSGLWGGSELILEKCLGSRRAYVQHKGAIAPEEYTVGVRHKQQAATFGMPDGCAAQAPDQFLQSRTVPFHQTQRGKNGLHSCDHQLLPFWLNKKFIPGKQQRSPKAKLKPDLPDRRDIPEMGRWSGQDFTKTNALSVINASPPRKQEDMVWTQKPDFGKVPEYLVQAQKLQNMQLAEREAAETLRLQQVGCVILLKGTAAALMLGGAVTVQTLCLDSAASWSIGCLTHSPFKCRKTGQAPCQSMSDWKP